MKTLICRLHNKNQWQQASYATWRSPHSEYFAAQILEHHRFVPYVQFENAGVVYRVVRVEDLGRYGVRLEERDHG